MSSAGTPTYMPNCMAKSSQGLNRTQTMAGNKAGEVALPWEEYTNWLSSAKGSGLKHTLK